MGATIRVGNLLGAGSPQIAKKVLKLALTITNSIMFTCAFVVFLSRHDFARIYTNDESVREKVADVVNVYGEFPHVCFVCVCVCMCVSFTCVRSCACFRWHFSLCSLTLRACWQIYAIVVFFIFLGGSTQCLRGVLAGW